MEFTTLAIDFPNLSGEQAALLQQTLYAFLDVFDAHYCFAIERYHQELLTQKNNTNASIHTLAHPLLTSEDPF
jgi:hypothetical protein